MADTILLTGATGFLGTELAWQLLCGSDAVIYALVRSENDDQAAYRLRCVWQHNDALRAQIGSRVIPVPGDFTSQDLGMSDTCRQELSGSVTLIIHAGAEIGFDKSREELDRVNREGTGHILEFARKARSLRRIVYISTAYVAGTRSGLIKEEVVPADHYASCYEQSKAAAEIMVCESGLPYSICRPGMIVGDSKSGRVKNFNTVYYVLKMMLQGKLRVLPIKAQTALNLVPVDYVAQCVAGICFSEEAKGRIFHLTCPENASPQAGELAEYVRKWAKENLSLNLPRPLYIPIPALKQAGIMHNRNEGAKKKDYLNNFLTLLPYFYADKEFDRSSTDAVCGPYSIRWRDYIDALLTFACRKNFMRQTGQTVFEQAMVRRASTRCPITYYNITEDGIRKVRGPVVNERIEKVRCALYAWGIRKGDRVALTGINSVDYLVLEQAIGLMGAVSVPVYYTTPAAEAEILLKKSGAKWFFVGDKRMLSQLEDMRTDAQIVLFSVVRKEKMPGAMSWKSFLKKTVSSAPDQYPDPDDLATIRYTSGTTGEPKGVTFSFRQLAWMGEVLSSLVSWEDRNRPMRYLSFLPLSHVVEGILASYAPYYMLTDVGYYYLNDFGALTDSLPKVRPTIFFSVPRFYEKLWDQVMANPVGKAWISAPKGVYKSTLAAVLKKAVLKKAGLDKCRQLIVGSAPVSETLLMNFRALGIEVHNAYGQTEAPLITINRLGDNVIPTIGTALPDTRITAGPDGELIVKGPQVTPGYYRLKTENIQDGVLHTGDLGIIHEDGHITLYGRKKDFIITAYGKNISIPKIEQRIKDIPGVSEAVLIGENRPYCTALIWEEQDVPDIDAQIEQMNRELSHPEQIRGYTVIRTPLSIQKGELTPNLKVKRANVEAHYAAQIEEMYR